MRDLTRSDEHPEIADVSRRIPFGGLFPEVHGCDPSFSFRTETHRRPAPGIRHVYSPAEGLRANDIFFAIPLQNQSV